MTFFKCTSGIENEWNRNTSLRYSQSKSCIEMHNDRVAPVGMYKIFTAISFLRSRDPRAAMKVPRKVAAFHSLTSRFNDLRHMSKRLIVFAFRSGEGRGGEKPMEGQTLPQKFGDSSRGWRSTCSYGALKEAKSWAGEGVARPVVLAQIHPHLVQHELHASRGVLLAVVPISCKEEVNVELQSFRQAFCSRPAAANQGQRTHHRPEWSFAEFRRPGSSEHVSLEGQGGVGRPQRCRQFSRGTSAKEITQRGVISHIYRETDAGNMLGQEVFRFSCRKSGNLLADH